MVALAGVRFEFAPDSALTSNDRTLLREIGGDSAGSAEPFLIDLVDHPLWGLSNTEHFPNGEPVLLEWVDDRIRATHRLLLGEIDAPARRATLFRTDGDTAALQMILRAALGSVLPLQGGMLLHSAGLVIDGRAYLFYGPSGAGKSTLAAVSPYPVLSDELVAIVRDGEFFARSTGFWGTLDRGDAPRGRFPLAALIEIRQTQELEIHRLDRVSTIRRLIGVTVVPPAGPLWNHALAVIGRLAHEVPSFSMGWHPGTEPWLPLLEAVS